MKIISCCRNSGSLFSAQWHGCWDDELLGLYSYAVWPRQGGDARRWELLYSAVQQEQTRTVCRNFCLHVELTKTLYNLCLYTCITNTQQFSVFICTTRTKSIFHSRRNISFIIYWTCSQINIGSYLSSSDRDSFETFFLQYKICVSEVQTAQKV